VATVVVALGVLINYFKSRISVIFVFRYLDSKF
jgi:hypothetical protein